MIRMKDLILASKYFKEVNCVLKYLENRNITTIDAMQNLPRHGHFCGIDVYQFVQEMNEVYKEKVLKQITTEVIEEEEE